MGQSSALTYPQRSTFRELSGFSVQRILKRKAGLRRPKVLSMALFWFLWDPGRKAPQGFQYLVLLWEEGLSL
jgi:hypothetical protein